MKLNGHAGRLSLIFQIMKWAVGEGDMQPVSLSSVKSAIRMVDYYEDTYHRIQEILLSNTIGDVKEDWLSQLGNTFTASDAIAAAKIYEIPRRTVFYALKKLCQAKQPILKKTSMANIEKFNTKHQMHLALLHFQPKLRNYRQSIVQKCIVQTNKLIYP